MKVLYLVQDGMHVHDYGCDYLYAGFCAMLGPENVFDFPEKGPLHLKSIDDRDECNISSDQCWPVKGHRIEDVAREADLVILAAPSPQLYQACTYVPIGTPIVAVDFGDALGDFRQPYERVANRPIALYFKRELPLGESFALPMPLSFPASRVPNPLPEKANRVHYWATSHGMGDPGKPRMAIAWALATSLAKDADGIFEHDGKGTVRILNEKADVWLTPGQAKGTRPSPERYWEQMAQSLVGISWNGALNWDCQRFWECFAFGLCMVAERPRIQILNQPEHEKHCWYVDNMADVAPAVIHLLNNEELARQIAADGHRHFLQYHSSEARALRIIDALGLTERVANASCV